MWKMKKPSDNEDDIATRCGIGRYRPNWLQFLNHPTALCTLLGIYIFIHGCIVTGAQSVNITGLEKRFHLSSVQIGWIASSVHISAATVGTLASFYATNHKARWLALSVAIGGVGLVLTGSPHFLTGPYDPQQGQDEDWNICKPNRTMCADPVDSGLSVYLYLLMFGNFLCGFSGSMILTVGVSFIDDSLPATTSPLYIDLVSSLWFVGIAVGYVLDGQALKLYVDFDTVSADSLDIEPSDVRWVGAWWLLFFLSAFVYVFLFVAFSLYGSELPSARKLRLLKTVTVDDESQDTEQQETAENMTETEISTTVHGVFKNSNNISNDTKETRNNTDASFKDRCSLKACSNHSRSMANEIATNGMPTLGDIEVENFKREHECDINNIKSNAENKKNCPRKIFAVRNSDEHTKEQRSIRKFVPILFKIVKSPVVVFLNISVALIFMFQTAIGLFLPKIIQNQFNQSTATAGLLAGVFIVPGIAFGQFLGGFVVKKLGLFIRGCFHLAVLCSIIGTPASMVWLIYCKRNDVYGLDKPYKDSSLPSTVSIGDPSNIISSCNQDCYCRTDVYEPICDDSSRQYYSPCYAGCTGILSYGDEVYINCSCLPGKNNSLLITFPACNRSCENIYYALPIMLIGIMLLNFTYVPVQTIILRLHNDVDKAFSLGIMWLFIRALGLVPGPLLLGSVLDAACDVWGKSCTQEVTSCLIYDNQLTARNLSLFSASIGLGLILMLLIAFTSYKMSTRSKAAPEP